MALPPDSSRTSDGNWEMEFTDKSEYEDDGVDEIIEGDFIIIVKVAGKTCIVHFIASVDSSIDGDEFEGVFLLKVSVKVQPGLSSFVKKNLKMLLLSHMKTLYTNCLSQTKLGLQFIEQIN